ncbi:MAG TPA: peptidase S8, partial [Actinobacteria bacterium]|nr:peptidase S8 [Actinomycetes bacterium]HEX21296.1 peptidase S8 [Actinomycetota bacterium]
MASSLAMASPSMVLKEKSRPRTVSVTTDEFAPDQIVVKFKATADDSEIEQKIVNDGDGKVYESPYEKVKVLKIPLGTSLKQAMQRYRGDNRVEYVKRDYVMKATMVPTDPYYSLQWNFFNSTYGGINMPAAWDKSSGQGVVTAVVDTGVAYENYGTKYAQAPDLAGVNFIPGWDFINNDSHPNDDDGHGTHVTGTIAQSTNNGIGTAGIAYNASIMPVKVLDQNGNGSYVQVADGIRYAADHGAKIINMSLGGTVPDTYLEDAVRYAYNKGVTIIAASGNDGAAAVDYPAAYNAYVIAVGATRYDEQKAYYSNSGSALDITAPGGDDTVDQNGDGYIDGILQQTFAPPKYKVFNYYFYTGTSMATPHVSGVAALILARNSTFTPAQVRNFIQSTAEDHGPPGWDADYGWGIVDANAAVPNLSISLNSDGQVNLGTIALGATTSTPPGSE